MLFLRQLFFLFAVIFISLPNARAAGTDSSASCCQQMEEEKNKYLGGSKFNEFMDFLNQAKDKDQAQPCRDYYKALTRYQQLKYLEENQSWDDYFANGNTYREQLEENANKVIAAAAPADCLKVKSRLLLWQYHQAQQDAFAQEALDELVASTQAYAAGAGSAALIKETADALSAGEEKSKARLVYKLYVDKLTAQKMSAPDLKKLAQDFYQQGNLELAQSIYDNYIDEIAKSLEPEKFSQELFQIASLFVVKKTGLYDMPYAEKIYSRIEKSSAKEAFDQDTIYLRAFNLEKMKEYVPAQSQYLKLIKDYPQNKHLEEVTYKVAMIYAYAQGNIEEARKYFAILAEQAQTSPHTIAALYQLGLLSQWQGDNTKADGYYQQLIKNAQDKFVLKVAAARERLQEIQENKPLEYNLKTFLDLSLKNEQALLEGEKTQVQSSAYILDKDQKNTIASEVAMPQSGCNQVELQYLWSGDMGGVKPQATESNFTGVYSDAGTKEINLVLVSPAGIIDRTFIMLDVY